MYPNNEPIEPVISLPKSAHALAFLSRLRVNSTSWGSVSQMQTLLPSPKAMDLRWAFLI